MQVDRLGAGGHRGRCRDRQLGRVTGVAGCSSRRRPPLRHALIRVTTRQVSQAIAF
jgi:hypothetical protein